MTPSFKAQPWKANWLLREVDNSVPSHNCPRGAVRPQDGDTVSKLRNFENISSNNNNKGSLSKAQPWKADWPPKKVDNSVPSHGCPRGAILSQSGDTVSKPRNLANASGTSSPQA